MIDRYINNKINAIWNDQNKFDTWKLIQEKYVETLEQLKIAQGGVAKKIQEAEVLKEEVYKQEEITNHDLASFVDILQNKVGDGSNWVHYGLTSSDIVDTANSLLIMQSIEVAQELIHDLLKELKLKAIDEKDTKIIGRTHGVYAEETFLGNIFGNWYLEIKRSLVRVERAKDSIAFGKLSGPFKDGQKGSSAMPHKKNPIGSERITGLARIMRGYTLSGLENMVLWNERDISNSSVERIALPDCFNLICFMTSELTSIISDLVINYEQIKVNLNNAKSKSMSQQMLSHLVNEGVNREEAYKVIQEESFKNLSPNEIKTNLEKHFSVEFPDFDTHDSQNISKESFEDKLT